MDWKALKTGDRVRITVEGTVEYTSSQNIGLRTGNGSGATLMRGVLDDEATVVEVPPVLEAQE